MSFDQSFANPRYDLVDGQKINPKTIGGQTPADAVDAQRLNSTQIVDASDSDLQSRVTNHDVVFLGPGNHANHSYPINVPNGTTIWPLGSGQGDPTLGNQEEITVLDAGGGLAITNDNGTNAEGITLGPFVAKGTIEFDATDRVRRVFLNRTVARDATTAAGSGRGISFRNNTFLCGGISPKAVGNEAEGFYLGNTGQVAFLDMQAFRNQTGNTATGNATDAAQVYITASEGNGGVGRFIAPTVGEPGANDAHNIVVDGGFHETIAHPYVENGGSGGTSGDCIRVTGQAARTTNVFIGDGGRIHDAAGDGISVGAAGGANQCRGVHIGGNVAIENNGGNDINWGANTWRGYEGEWVGGAGHIGNGTTTVSGSAFRVQRSIVTSIYAAQGTNDLTSTTGSYLNEFQVHDGTAPVTSSILCRWEGNRWRPLAPVEISYTGDGTTGRTLAGTFEFEQVMIEESGGAAVDAYLGAMSNGAMSGGSFTGELTVEVAGGFTVGDGGSDADPNTNGESYAGFAT